MSESGKHESAENECRICFDTIEQDSMITPCNCSGSMKYVHKQCLLSWINTIHGIKCIVCGTQYRCQLTVKRPHLWTFLRQNLGHLLSGFLVLLHICFVMISSQIICVYVLNGVLKYKCLSVCIGHIIVEKLYKILIINVMIIFSAMNAFCFIIFFGEFREELADRWNQYLEYSFQ